MNTKEKLSKIMTTIKSKLSIGLVVMLIISFSLGSMSTNDSSLLDRNNELGLQVEELNVTIQQLYEQEDAQNNEIDNYEKELKALQTKNEELDNKNISLAKELETATDKNSELSALEDQQSSIDALNKQIAELSSNNSSLTEQIASLNNQLAEKQTASSQAATQPHTEPQTDTQTEPQEDNTVSGGASVYWVAKGEVYHSTSSCSTLRRSKNIYSGSIAESGKSRGCKVCY